ncbi:DHA2 family efflux MFS transporter permease subunit [Actinomadura harenae]|uniref:DHA2 family efflux MFS transporter permease subunit n=1 Tax=Actinomadura harenae TaxID=2483351 RepID=A0A3M2MJK1_9ACTN|nr:DHA2 family efflux MFS transporter permease subunit [Actinomadura harenae]RMI47558.1 DHA2 family efflux MFS transporter permease subunit [Actinomadura harenae]
MKPHALRTLVVTGIALFMVTLDNLIVTNALPAIREDLGTGLEGLEWTVNAYTLTFAVLLLPAAAIADRHGRRRLFMIGLALFTVASAAAALAPGIGTLIAARAVQGLGGAILAPLTLTLLAHAVPPARRAAALAAWSVMSGLGVALGPIVGGAVTEYATWEWIFWINVPTGLLVLGLAPRFLTESRGPAQRLDPLGTVLITLGLLGVVLGLVRGNGHGWTSPQVLGAEIVGLILLAAFLVHEARTPHPMLPLTLFRSRGFTLMNLINLAMCFGMFGVTFLLIQFLQMIGHMSPLEAGVRTLPWTAMPLLVAPLTALLTVRLGTRPVIALALLFQAVGLAWLAIRLSPTFSYADLVPGFVLAGIGMGLFFPPVTRLVLGFAPPTQTGVASGVSNVSRQLGTLLGVAALGAVFSATGDMTNPHHYANGVTTVLWTAAAVLTAAALSTLAVPQLTPSTTSTPTSEPTPTPTPQSAPTT